MSLNHMLSDSAKRISNAGMFGAREEARTQAILIGQFTVGLIACDEHRQAVGILQKAVTSLLMKGGITKRLRRRMRDVPNQVEAVEDVRFHCHKLTLAAEEAAEGDVAGTLGVDVLKTERELRSVVEALQAWTCIMVREDWDAEADVQDALEEAQEALSKLDGIQKEAMALRDQSSS